jgi:ankyrin repeat protein
MGNSDSVYAPVPSSMLSQFQQNEHFELLRLIFTDEPSTIDKISTYVSRNPDSLNHIFMLSGFKLTGLMLAAKYSHNQTYVTTFGSEKYVLKSSIEIVECLLNLGADVNYQITEKTYPCTALTIAVRGASTTSNIATVVLLVNRGADVNGNKGPTKYNRSPLMYAVIDDPNIEVIKYLISVGANVPEQRSTPTSPKITALDLTYEAPATKNKLMARKILKAEMLK